MKRFTASVLILLAALVTAGRLHAQSTEVRASIPFSFVVNGRTLPAGTYNITTPQRYVLRIENSARAGAIMSALSPYDRVRAPQPMLVFNRYGDRYFLHEIDGMSGNVVSKLPTSKAEKQVQQMQASIRAEQVTVAMGD